jgi:uncharacterized protein YeaO (DUF488 family)
MYAMKTKRVYLSPDPGDGYRVLVDRLWPRGIKKAAAGLDNWVRTIAPSTALRKSFAHQPGRFGEFQTAYRDELNNRPEAREFARFCKTELSSHNVTLLYAAKDEICNNASVLLEWIREQMEEERQNG